LSLNLSITTTLQSFLGFDANEIKLVKLNKFIETMIRNHNTFYYFETA